MMAWAKDIIEEAMVSDSRHKGFNNRDKNNNISLGDQLVAFLQLCWRSN